MRSEGLTCAPSGVPCTGSARPRRGRDPVEALAQREGEAVLELVRVRLKRLADLQALAAVPPIVFRAVQELVTIPFCDHCKHFPFLHQEPQRLVSLYFINYDYHYSSTLQ